MINDLYVLLTGNNSEIIVCSNCEFIEADDDFYTLFDLEPQVKWDDHTELINFIKDFMTENELLYGTGIEIDNIKFHIFTKLDLIELKNGSVFGRNFEVYPIIYNDCNLQGQLLSESDVVQFIVDDPNGKSNIVTFSNQPQNVQQLGEILANSPYVDNNCNLYMHNVEEDQTYGIPNLYQVQDGKFIIPAEIVEQ